MYRRVVAREVGVGQNALFCHGVAWAHALFALAGVLPVFLNDFHGHAKNVLEKADVPLDVLHPDGDMLQICPGGVHAVLSFVDQSWRFSAYSGPMQSTNSGPMQSVDQSWRFSCRPEFAL